MLAMVIAIFGPLSLSQEVLFGPRFFTASGSTATASVKETEASEQESWRQIRTCHNGLEAEEGWFPTTKEDAPPTSIGTQGRKNQ